MAEALIVRRGGGDSLNFKVVGGTGAQDNPKENTIWVNTDIPITHWAFSATRPDNLIKSYYIEPSLDRFVTVLYAEMELKPNTTYTIAFEGNAGQEFYLNEAITPYKAFAVTPYWNTVTFTTHSELDKSSLTQYQPSYGWLLLKNEINQPSAPAFRGLRIVEGDKDIEPAGSVWIPTGTSSTAPFNALKKNGITVYPMSAKQHVNGVWVEREAKIYQNGVWSEWWAGDIYSYGDEIENITGGWVAQAKSWPDVPNNVPTITYNDTSVTIKCAHGGGIYRTVNKIPFNGKKTLRFTGSADGDGEAPSGSLRCMLVVWSAIGTDVVTQNVVAQYLFPQNFSGEATINISSLNGDYYVGYHSYSGEAITMEKLKLE